MSFTQKDWKMMEHSLESLKRANSGLRELSLESACKDVSNFSLFSGKKDADTKMLDAVPEEYIVAGHEGGAVPPFTDSYGIYGIVMSEERGKSSQRRILPETPVVISDPLDGSTRLKGQLEDNLGRFGTVGDMFDSYRQEMGGLAEIVAPVSSITLMKDGELKYSLVLNLFTGMVYAACDGGVYSGQISDELRLDELLNRDNMAEWRSQTAEGAEEKEKPSIFCNRKGKAREENFTGCHMADFFEHYTAADYFAGPSRFVYLLDSSEAEYPELDAIGFNREPISEWISDICFAQNSGGALRAYLMSPDRQEIGLFRNSLIEGLDAESLNRIDYPSNYRASLVIAPAANESSIRAMEAAAEKGYAIRLV